MGEDSRFTLQNSFRLKFLVWRCRAHSLGNLDYMPNCDIVDRSFCQALGKCDDFITLLEGFIISHESHSLPQRKSISRMLSLVVSIYSHERGTIFINSDSFYSEK
ncbi:hypothetical protein H5410_056058 [Solanum commersonii]|uniref:Uncharacterized protein n=1 Tax=Solanum commersonii TaxID=4109 RepID=A0A9J5WL61_SOLCO|nr:hypothetical protein H5410_056058 [Solanum commersonii]